MVRTLSRSYNHTAKTIRLELFADSVDDVKPDLGVDIVPEGYSIEQGSRCKVASGEVYYMMSNGQWMQDTKSPGGGGGGGDDRQATEEEVEEAIDDIVDDLHL